VTGVRTTVRACDWCGRDFDARWNYLKKQWATSCSKPCFAKSKKRAAA